LFWAVHEFGADSDGNLYTAEVFGGRSQKFRPRSGADPTHVYKPQPLMPRASSATTQTGIAAPTNDLPSKGGGATFSGTWTLAKTEPPVAAGRGGRGGPGGGGIAGPYADTLFAQAPPAVTITQMGTAVSVEIGGKTASYTIDGKTKADGADGVNALKTRAHWDGATLHLHFKQGMNWGRDMLTVSGSTLTIVRDLESGGQSTTRTLTYSRTS
jgi:hypothetical protein